MRAIEALEKLPLDPKIKEGVRKVLLAAQQGKSICVMCKLEFPMKPDDEELLCEKCRQGPLPPLG